MTRHYDVLVVGGGIVGLSTAREYLRRRPSGRIAVLERESTVGAHQTGHNSGVIHSGIYYEPGSLKARLCVEGARLMYEYVAEHGIPHERCGKLIVAIRKDELSRLDALEARGHANGVPGLRRVSGPEIREIEPAGHGIAALHSPETGIVDFGVVAATLAAELRAGGVDLLLGVTALRIEESARCRIVTDREELTADRVVACAGLWSDRLAAESGAGRGPRIVPFRGAYLGLSASRGPELLGMIYPVPDPTLPFLGVHLTKHIDGKVFLGPTALTVPSRTGYRLTAFDARDLWETVSWPGFWRVARTHWRTGISEMRLASSRRAFVRRAAEYAPSLTVDDLDGTTRAGVRAQAIGRDGALVDDFLLTRTARVTHVRNAPSPAATSAFALARELVDLIERS